MNTKLNTILAAALLTLAGAASAQTTLGTGAIAQSGIAIGPNAMQGDVAAGTLSPTQPAYTGGIAIGQGANANGKNIALGQGISAPQDGIAGFYTLAIGGFNSVTGTTDFRRIVGVASGMFSSDGANMQNVWDARDQAISTSNSYTDMSISNALMPVNFMLANHTARLGNVEQLSANNAARLDQHDIILADHDQRITTAQNTADTALTTATVADGKATTALSQSGQALAIAQQTQQELAHLTTRVDGIENRISNLETKVNGMDRRVNGGVALAMAANSAVAVNLAPGETAIVGGIGGFRGQAALSLGVQRVNYAGQSFRAVVSTSSVGTAVGVGGAFKF
ncbi:hypothetical protein [Roseateles sp. MS654]|uniref:hypothetical protein n=1 Tax=Roseateles sp. MS654 TaxID=3412685 RepID=UPI003C306D70